MKNIKIRRERNIKFTVHHRVTFRDAYSDETRDCTNQSPTRIDWTGLKHGNKTLGFDEWFSFKFSMMANMSLSGIGNWRMSLPVKFISQRSRKIISAKLIRWLCFWIYSEWLIFLFGIRWIRGRGCSILALH